MARRKISEYRAKTIVNNLIGMRYVGWPIVDGKMPTSFGATDRFVVKVDQAIKQRFKKGLILLDVPRSQLESGITKLRRKGYRSLLVEPYVTHDADEERYISLRREREGVMVSYSRSGGVEIESHLDTVRTGRFVDFALDELAAETGFTIRQLEALHEAFDRFHMALMEINPYVAERGKLRVLDVAIEVDASAELLVDAWSEMDMRSPAVRLTEEEIAVHQLAKESPASFSLEVVNPDGSIFLLLSGGGASVVIADEIYTLGHGKELANYGEYSGNPNESETYRYASQVIKLLLKSKAPKKVVFIGGAVANFTDIATTFSGIIRVLQENASKLQKQGVKFYVRRGGPRQELGLRRIQRVLNELNLLGGVYDPHTSIPEAVQQLLGGLKK